MRARKRISSQTCVICYRSYRKRSVLDAEFFRMTTVAILLGNGKRDVSIARGYAVGGSDPGWLTAGDFNGDGKLDLAVANGYGGGPPVPTVSILLGKGNGTF
jgi:hypothetical protein